MAKELEQFQNDLLDSVRQKLPGKAARVTEVQVSTIAAARSATGLVASIGQQGP